MTYSSVPLSLVASVNPRGWTDAPEPEEPVSFIRMAAIEAGTGKLDSSHHRPWTEVQKGYTKFEEGDVLVAKITPSMENGKAALAVGLAGGRGVGSTEFHVLRPTEQLDPRYLLHYVLQSSFRRAARAQMRGVAGQLRVPPEFFNDVEIPVPPLDEQKQIVAEFETQFARLDDAVAALVRARARLKRYRASVLKAACEGRLVPTEAELARREGRDYEPASVLLERIKVGREACANGKHYKIKKTPPLDTSSLPGLPEAWVWTKLDDILDSLRNGLSTRAETKGTTPILRISAVRPLNLDPDEHRFVSRPVSEVEDYFVEPGDILFTRYNGNPDLVGVSAVVPQLNRSMLHPDKLIRGRFNEVSPDCMAIMLNSGTSKETIRSRVKTTAGQAGISGSDLKSVPVPIPPLREQDRIVAEVERRLSVIDQLKRTTETNLKRAEALRQSILRMAFSGTSLHLRS